MRRSEHTKIMKISFQIMHFLCKSLPETILNPNFLIYSMFYEIHFPAYILKFEYPVSYLSLSRIKTNLNVPNQYC